MKRLLTLAIATAALCVAKAQKVVVELSEDQLKPIRSQIIRQHEDNRANTMDWANFRRYAKANAQVTKRPKAVLMGNSITEGWADLDGEWLSAHNLVGRGISGQVSSQMLVRFRQDVIGLKPECVVIMCGINDIGLNQGRISVENIMGNIISMAELAKANNIKPLLCSVTPAAKIGWRPQVTDTPDQVKRLNKLIEEYAKANKITYIDYYSALVDTDGASLKKEYARDEVHPNLAGYKVMEEILAKALKLK
jgi:lysophospholipase L1-like esterase